ncbi:MAG: IS1595 family transposase [Hyphomicrobium sp.]|uniref:IS1595 family transposase n=1 Tax=Hyphomicrobium sp. TaxID=82 RepID=UPI00132B41E9|nr:IS1595 family transposase [Hyphomicrobium sp.]KAB2944104.1 MAG: IS1595 family transposase [Hyphomicrobium sp.]MBZ0209399.1 IS1595 family transposase [Hyphomicrobium sp.]
MSILNAAHFHDEAAAITKLESIVWPEGPVCPHCGHHGETYVIKGARSKPSKKHPEGVERHGLRTCKECRKQFTVKVGTVFESSHIPVHKWWQAVHLLCSSKKGISAHQLHRTLQITYKSAWFMAHRIREAMREGGLAPMGGNGGVVEIDETYHGPKEGAVKGRGGFGHKRVILTLVNRQGSARSFHVDKSNTANVLPIVKENLSNEAVAVTDESRIYDRLGEHAARHLTVNHARGEYVSQDRDAWIAGDIHTNTVEGYFSIFKRGMRGVYQHCSEKHLHRYLAEFDFRYSARSALGVEDEARASKAIKGIKGKRLTYRQSSDQEQVENN